LRGWSKPDTRVERILRARVVGVWTSVSISIRVATVACPITVEVALVRVGLLQAVVRSVWYAIVVPVATSSVASAHTPRSERRVVRVALLQAVVPVVSFPVVVPVVSFPVVVPAVSFPVVPVASSHKAGKQARYQCCLVRVVLLQAVVQAVR